MFYLSVYLLKLIAFTSIHSAHKGTDATPKTMYFQYIVYRILIGCHSVHPKLLFPLARSRALGGHDIRVNLWTFFMPIVRANIYYWGDLASVCGVWNVPCHVREAKSITNTEQQKTVSIDLYGFEYSQTPIIVQWILHFRFPNRLVPHPCSDSNNLSFVCRSSIECRTFGGAEIEWPNDSYN